ncbi:2-oxoacid:acceptor oxidoreductase subunit alpha [Candidatus Bipolaricaulota bacterium]|nr:2-oxoacid:acceptor oxidoreductase subunit alpha [Candidatus Bipolaricaulota bacterium]
MKDRSIFIVGSAGEGIQTVGDVVARALLRSGVSVFTSKEYESRIRGGNSSYRIRASGPNAPRHDADVILALNSTAAAHYQDTASSNCLVLGELSPGGEGIRVPFQALAKEQFSSLLYANSIAAGCLGAVLGISQELLADTLCERFSRLTEEVLRLNVDALALGYKHVLPSLDASSTIVLDSSSSAHSFISVHDAIALAAVAAGCRFMAAYPMSPATGIMTTFAKDPELGVFVEQAEDEIAAINMSLAASAAGARAMTATSGGGFALMTEGISLAGMTETPLVVVVAQRPGPATGLPTRTAQEDLNFAIHGGHGEFPRAVLAPSDPKDAIDAIYRAFDWAERFQTPVLVLSDQFLADSHFSVMDISIPQTPVPSGLADPSESGAYQRYALTEDGISPRLALGQSEHLVRIDSDEHTEEGHITEDLEFVRPAMVEKRLEKMRRLKREIPPPDDYRTDDAETVLISWGSSRGAVVEAVDRLRGMGQRVGSLHFTTVWPLPQLSLPAEVKYWTIEGNATGQFARLLQAEGDIQLVGKIERYDGMPIDAASILAELAGDHSEVDA